MISRFRETLAEIEFEWRTAWSAYLMIAIILAVMGSCALLHGPKAIGPTRWEHAKIVGFGAPSSKYAVGKVAVVVSDKDGVTGTVVVPFPQVQGCKIGDPIEAERTGILLSPDPKPCK